MNSIALTLEQLFRLGGNRWIVHLSGGFKAAIPTLISVLQLVACRQLIKVQICFEPRDGNEVNAIEIPLLSFNEAEVLSALEQPEATRFKHVLSDPDGGHSAVWTAVDSILSARQLEPEDYR
jgi:hypothetical protein